MFLPVIVNPDVEGEPTVKSIFYLPYCPISLAGTAGRRIALTADVQGINRTRPRSTVPWFWPGAYPRISALKPLTNVLVVPHYLLALASRNVINVDQRLGNSILDPPNSSVIL